MFPAGHGGQFDFRRQGPDPIHTGIRGARGGPALHPLDGERRAFVRPRSGEHDDALARAVAVQARLEHLEADAGGDDPGRGQIPIVREPQNFRPGEIGVGEDDLGLPQGGAQGTEKIAGFAGQRVALVGVPIVVVHRIMHIRSEAHGAGPIHGRKPFGQKEPGLAAAARGGINAPLIPLDAAPFAGDGGVVGFEHRLRSEGGEFGLGAIGEDGQSF